MEKTNSLEIYSVLNCIDGNIVVVGRENYTFTFSVITEPQKGVTFCLAKVRCKDKFIECSDINGKYMYIYCGDDTFEIHNTKKVIKTTLYIESTVQIKSINEKCFCVHFNGGALNKIYPPRALSDSRDGGKHIIEINNSNDKFKLRTKKYDLDCFICSNYIVHRGIDDGFSISDSDSMFCIDTLVSINDIISIKEDLCRFMNFLVYRNDTYVKEVELFILEVINGKEHFRKVANCFFYNEYKEIKKKSFECLGIRTFNSEQICKLWYLINDAEINGKKEFGISIDFIPRTGSTTVFDKNRVKETVTSLECALNRFSLFDVNSQTLALIDLLQKTVDDYIDNNVDNEIKSQIEIAIGNSNYPIKRRFKNIFLSYEIIIKEYLSKHYIDFVDKYDIDNIIKNTINYRNNNTHNSCGKLSEEIALGTIIFTVCIYSIVLSELGFSNDKIKEIICEYLI